MTQSNTAYFSSFSKILNEPINDDRFKEIRRILQAFVSAVNEYRKGKWANTREEVVISRPFKASYHGPRSIYYTINLKTLPPSMNVREPFPLLRICVYDDHINVVKTYQNDTATIKCNYVSDMLEALSNILKDPFFRELL